MNKTEKHLKKSAFLTCCISLLFGCKQQPKEFENIPRADETGLVLKTMRVEVPGIPIVYNGSLAPCGEDYLLAFRFDLDCGKSHIGLIALDTAFQPKGPYQIVNTSSTHSEDPRLFLHQKKYHLLYNDLLSEYPYYRTMRIGTLDLKIPSVENISILDPCIQSIEKNWVPFGQDHLFFLYHFNPHKILEFAHASLSHLSFPNHLPLYHYLWEHKWGEIRGGTPALFVDGEYLSFFHSSFSTFEKPYWFFGPSIKHIWYVMGAYTFQSIPPYKITKISKHPILFTDLYSTPHKKLSSRTHVIFPAGLIEKNGVFFVSCGENDSAIKIIAIDKQKLFESLHER